MLLVPKVSGTELTIVPSVDGVCPLTRVGDGGGRERVDPSIHILYTYSTVFVTTVFPASSETIENVLSDRKSVCD